MRQPRQDAIWIAAQRIARWAGYLGPVDVYRNGALHASAVTVAIVVPGDDAAWRVLADIGGERASSRGDAAPGTDIKSGDQLRISGGATYVVEGARPTPLVVMLALSEVAA